MKIRSGFVSNSSSASFIVGVGVANEEQFKALMEKYENYYELKYIKIADLIEHNFENCNYNQTDYSEEVYVIESKKDVYYNATYFYKIGGIKYKDVSDYIVWANVNDYNIEVDDWGDIIEEDIPDISDNALLSDIQDHTYAFFSDQWVGFDG